MVRWKLAAGVVLTCVGIEAYVLADRSNGEPRNKDIRRYVLGEIVSDTLVAQQFHVRADGLSSVTIYPRRISDDPAGAATVVLRDVGSGVVYREETPLSVLAEAGALTLRFPPQPLRERDYRIEFTVTDAPRGRGIGLLATRGEGYRRAALSLNDDRPRWGDLVFETGVEGATSNFGSIAAQLGRSGIPAPRAVLALLLTLKSGILFLLIRTFTVERTSTSKSERATARVP